MLRRHFSSPSH